jgi:putative transposase
LGAVIQQFKRACSHRIHEAGHPNFQWLSRFHDRIIHDDIALDTIRRYIENNPQQWDRDIP